LLSKGKGGRGVEKPPDKEIVELAQSVVRTARDALGADDVAVRRQGVMAMEKAAATCAASVELISDPKGAASLPPVARELSKDEKEAIQDYQQKVERGLNEVGSLAAELGKQGDALGRLLQDADPETRLQAARALGELAKIQTQWIRVVDSIPSIPGEKKPGETAAAPLASLKQGLSEALPALAHALGDPVARVRLATVTALDRMDREAAVAVDALVKALKDSNIFVRWVAARSLGNIDPSAGKVAVPELGRLLFDPDLDVRLAAATALEHYGNQAGAAVEDLIRAVSVGDAEIRIAVIHAIEAIGPDAKSAVPALAKALEDPDERVRRAAAETLGRFGPLAQTAEPALKKALDDKDTNVRRAVSGALLSVSQKE
jgi:HEAT repeat protein